MANYANVDGVRLYFEVAGEGDPLVLVHAGIADSRMWDDQFHALAQNYRVIRYDARGYGRSDPAAGTAAHYRDLHGLLSLLAVERAYLVGCSMGAGIIFDFALAYPHRAAALIAVNGVPHGYQWPEGSEDAPQWEEVLAAWKAGDLERTAELEVQIWIDGRFRSPADVDPALRDKVRAMNLIALTNEAASEPTLRHLQPPAAQRLDELHMSTLFIVGELDDPDIVAALHTLTEEIQDARLITIPGTTHLPNMEKPQQFNQHLLAFLSSL